MDASRIDRINELYHKSQSVGLTDEEKEEQARLRREYIAAIRGSLRMQEILTVKSDDVTGRVRTYEAIVKGENIPQPGVPESFKVLIKELQSLCLDVRILDENGDEIELKDDEDDFIPGMRDEMSYKSDDDEITGSGFTIEDVPVDEDDDLGAFSANDGDDYTDDADKEEE